MIPANSIVHGRLVTVGIEASNPTLESQIIVVQTSANCITGCIKKGEGKDCISINAMEIGLS